MNPTSSTLRALIAGEVVAEQVQPRGHSRFRDAVGRVVLMLSDALAVVLAVLVEKLIGAKQVTPWALALPLIFWLLASMAGLYGRDEHVVNKTTLDEVPKLLGVAAIFVVVVFGSSGVWFGDATQPFLIWLTLTSALCVARSLTRLGAARLAPAERVLIIGDPVAATRIGRAFTQNPGLNAIIVGRLASGPEADGSPDDGQLLGEIRDLGTVLRDHRVERVLVVSAEAAGHQGVEVVTLAKALGVKVALLPPLLEVMGSSVEYDGIGGQALLSMRPFGLSRPSQVLKRALDITVAGSALIVVAPLMALIALTVKLTSPGPVIFRQARVGREGASFEMMKFRTMVADAERRRLELHEHNEAAPLFKIANDPRITSVGGFLRRHALDELPQLINVLRGEMSIVGPRPLLLEEDQLFSGWQRLRNHVAPGITGPWQVLGSTRVPLDDMLTLDYLYGANWSLWLDVKIILRTIPAIFGRRSGEYPLV